LNILSASLDKVSCYIDFKTILITTCVFLRTFKINLLGRMNSDE